MILKTNGGNYDWSTDDFHDLMYGDGIVLFISVAAFPLLQQKGTDEAF